jgi:hypothetical protein
MGYVMTAVVIFAVAFTGWGVMHIKHETAPTYRPTRRVSRRLRPIAAGDPCPCGVGTVGPASGPAGDLLACTNCDRTWTTEGIKLVRRMRSPMRRNRPVPEHETTPEEV